MAEIYKSQFSGQEIDERLELVPELQEGVEAAQQAADGKYTKPASGIPMTDLSDEVQEAIEEGGVQADWEQEDTTAPDYIKNKPDIPTAVVRFTPQTLAPIAQAQARANIGAGTYSKPATGIPAEDIADGVIPDVSGFITNTVNNLVNYYLKSETYSRSEVQQLIAAIQGVSFVSVASLPTASADTMGGKIYLVPSANPDEQNVKDEFITIQNGSTYAWEQIGSTAIDLSGYVTTQQLNTALAAYTTTEALTALLAAKQDTIQDLSAIRNGAAAGATAYQKPQTGIPASDLAAGVIPTVPTDVVKYSSQSLTDAQQTQARTNIGAAAAAALTALETAIAAKYTKPSTGIPETDLAANVQSALALARTSIQSLADYYDKTEIDSLLAAVSSEQYVDVTTLPTASASTLGKIYLVGPTNGVYDRYYTSYDGTTYSWVGVGTTEINLANYATKAELSQLSQEINGTTEDVVVPQESYINAGAYSYWTGLWRFTPSYTGIFIPIIGASKIKVQAAQGGKAYTLFCSYIIQVGSTNISVSSDGELKEVAAGEAAEFDVPSDASFLWCSTNRQDGRAAPTVTLLNLQTTSGIYPIVESVLQDLNGSASDIRISPTTFTLAGNFGFWSDRWHSSNAHYGAFVPVESGKKIKITTFSKQFYGVFCTGTAQSNNSAVSVSTVDSTTKSLSANSSAIYTVPSDAKYLWYNVNSSDGRDTPLVLTVLQTLGLKDRADVDESRLSTLEGIVAGIAEYVTFGTDDDWLTSNNVQVFFNTVRNKAAYHNSSGHWLVDGIKCCKNPVVYYDCPDMSIIAVGGTIYGYSSGSLGGQIYKTDNFAKWEKLNSRILPIATYSNYWAPDANIIDGKIVIYFSCDSSLVIATSNTPAPEDGFTIEATFNYGNIDYCYFDGVLFYGSGTIAYRIMTDYKTPSDTVVTTNMQGEGVMIWHHGGYYYAFCSVRSSQNYHYDIGVYRSATLQNNTWEFGGVILKTDSEAMLCGPGHISEIFQDNDGHYFAMMQVHIYDSGWSFRPTSIQELIVNSSGWPQFVDYQGNITTEPQLLSRAPAMPVTIEKTN